MPRKALPVIGDCNTCVHDNVVRGVDLRSIDDLCSHPGFRHPHSAEGKRFYAAKQGEPCPGYVAAAKRKK